MVNNDFGLQKYHNRLPMKFWEREREKNWCSMDIDSDTSPTFFEAFEEKEEDDDLLWLSITSVETQINSKWNHLHFHGV